MGTDINSPLKTMFFVSSPLETRLPPEDLRNAVPRGKHLHFRTTDKCPMTARSTSRRCLQHGLQLLATTTTDVPEQKDKKLKESEALSFKQDVVNKQSQEIKDLKEEIAKLLDITGGLNQRVQLLEWDMGAMDDLYGMLGTTRRFAVVNLLAVLLNLLDHQILVVVKDDRSDWIGKDKLFSKEGEVGYLRTWWCWYNQVIHVDGVTLEEYWNKKISFKGKKRIIHDAKKWGIVKDESLAQKVDAAMSCAESSLIQSISGEMTQEMLRDSVGFYISIIQSTRNVSIHFFENLFSIVELNQINCTKWKRKRHKQNRFQLVNKSFSINKEYVETGIRLLEDILSNVNRLGADLECISSTVKWVASYLLLKCNETVEGHVEVNAEDLAQADINGDESKAQGLAANATQALEGLFGAVDVEDSAQANINVDGAKAQEGLTMNVAHEDLVGAQSTNLGHQIWSAALGCQMNRFWHDGYGCYFYQDDAATGTWYHNDEIDQWYQYNDQHSRWDPD